VLSAKGHRADLGALPAAGSPLAAQVHTIEVEHDVPTERCWSSLPVCAGFWAGGPKGHRDGEAAGGTKHWPWRRREIERDGAESGVGSAADARRLRATGADAALVGEMLMRSHDPEATVRELRLA
jgi:hypothetical protein